MFFIKLLIESFSFALNAITTNKVRTVLSLSGITIGIFSIISVFTVFDSMEIAIKSNLSSLGNNIVFVTKWPLIGDANFPWWKYWNRPEPAISELREIQRRTQAAEAAAIDFVVARTIKYQSNYVENATVHAVSQDYDRVISFEIADGRYFSPIESAGGKPVTVIGSEIAENLFENLDPIGKEIKVMGSKVQVIGVIKKEGKDNFGNTHDTQILIPINFARNYVNINEIGMTIMVKARPNVSMEELTDELTGVMRSIRKLKPAAEDNFEIGEISMLTSFIDRIFGVISIVGWIIGGFALLVGGFGIANIMFVSVKERTSQIGIQKALGAKNYFILFQFIFESVFLSLFGGVVGLLLVFIGTLIAEKPIGMELYLTTGNVMVALLVSGGIGLIFGFIPAFTAARLDPVKAMRSTF
jgi:putative ABC transport system permease protein